MSGRQVLCTMALLAWTVLGCGQVPAGGTRKEPAKGAEAVAPAPAASQTALARAAETTAASSATASVARASVQGPQQAEAQPAAAEAEDDAEDEDAGDDDGDEEKVAPADLPQAVTKALESRFPGATIEEAERETKGGKTIYEVEVVHEGVEYEVEVSEAGEILEVEQDREEDEKD